MIGVLITRQGRVAIIRTAGRLPAGKDIAHKRTRRSVDLETIKMRLTALGVEILIKGRRCLLRYTTSRRGEGGGTDRWGTRSIDQHPTRVDGDMIGSPWSEFF